MIHNPPALFPTALTPNNFIAHDIRFGKHEFKGLEYDDEHEARFINRINGLLKYEVEEPEVLTEAQSLYMVHYRLAPEYPFPAALEDAFKAYEYILNQGVEPENIIVIGDSAGGNLALELAVYLKEHNKPQPKMRILISPLTTFANDLPSRGYNMDRDLVLGRNASPLYKAVEDSTYSKGTDLKNPQLSPLYANLTGLPPC